MAIRMADQVLAYDPATRQVVSLQLWAGFVRDLHGFAMVVNGEVVQRHSGSATGMRRRFTAAGSLLNPAHVIDEEPARRHLRDLTGADTDRCGCGAQLPMGGLWCAGCGQPHRARAAAGV